MLYWRFLSLSVIIFTSILSRSSYAHNNDPTFERLQDYRSDMNMEELTKKEPLDKKEIKRLQQNMMFKLSARENIRYAEVIKENEAILKNEQQKEHINIIGKKEPEKSLFVDPYYVSGYYRKVGLMLNLPSNLYVII